MKNVINSVQVIVAVIIPLVLVLSAVYAESWILALATVVSVYTLIACLPLFKKQRVRWMFILMFLALMPINITVLSKVLSSWFFEDSWLLTNILRGIVFFMIVVSIEEIICCVVARLLWRQ